jgi:VanZ family protein
MKSNQKLLALLIFLLLLILLFLVPSDLTAIVFKRIQLDTLGHIIGFFGLTYLLVTFIKLPLINTVICLFLYSALTEISQYYLGFRNGELVDVIADIVGISLFAVMRWLFLLYSKPQYAKT